jgi:hypothetical protein
VCGQQCVNLQAAGRFKSSEDETGGQPKCSGSPSINRPTWSKTFGCSATSAFCFGGSAAAATNRDKSEVCGGDDGGLVAERSLPTADQLQWPFSFRRSRVISRRMCCACRIWISCRRPRKPACPACPTTPSNRNWQPQQRVSLPKIANRACQLQVVAPLQDSRPKSERKMTSINSRVAGMHVPLGPTIDQSRPL